MKIPFLPDRRVPALLNAQADGAWKAWSSEAVAEQVRRMAAGLRALGLRPGGTVGILADPSPHWVMMDLAVLAAGGISVPLFANISPENLEYQIRDSGMCFLFAAARKDLERAQAYAGRLERIVTLEPGGAGQVNWEDALEAGEDAPAPDDEAIRPDAPATIVYTSGSTGFPKGAMLTRANFESQVRGAAMLFPLAPGEVVVSMLPLAHAFERTVVYYYLSAGCSIHFVDDPKRLGEHLRELRPVAVTAVPRLLEKVQAKMLAGAEAAKGPRGVLARAAMRDATTRDPEAPRRFEPARRLFDALVYARLRKALGGRLRYLISGGAALPVPVGRFFLNIGLPLYEGYGMTECSPVVAVNAPGRTRLGTVGRHFPGVEVALSDEGEILVRGPNVMKGYLGHERETREMLGEDGWLRTGDLGELDADGFLKIRGRKKEIFKTSTGEYVSPVPLEAALVAHPLIESALVIAEGRKFASCLIVPDFERLETFRAANGLAALPLAEVLRHERFVREIAAAVEAVGHGRNPWERLRAFRILEEPFSIERGEMTPTLKIRRHVAEERYAEVIREMYGENEK